MQDAVRAVRDAVLFGALFAVLVLALFLRDLRATLIAAVSLPLTLGASLLVLDALGETLNLMSLGGLAVAFTSTPGQRPVAESLAEGAATSAPGDVAGLAAALGRWAQDKSLLGRAKAAAWAAAQRRWHWEHAAERGALLEAVGRVCGH